MKFKINHFLTAVLILLVTFTTTTRNATAATTSPARIAFAAPVTDRKTQQTTKEVCSINPDGSGFKQHTKVGLCNFPVWTRNQSHIAYWRWSDDARIYVVDVKSGKTFPVVQALGQGHEWSPDDGGILYTGRDTVGSGLWFVSVNLATGLVGTPVLVREGHCFSPKYSPDGRKIAFEVDGRVTILDLATREEITFPPWSSGHPTWSPLGNQIAFRGYVCDSSTGLCFWEIFMARADGTGWGDGTGFSRMTTLQSHSSRPAWSPDGQTLLFYSDVSGSDAIYKMALSTGTINLLIPGAIGGVDW